MTPRLPFSRTAPTPPDAQGQDGRTSVEPTPSAPAPSAPAPSAPTPSAPAPSAPASSAAAPLAHTPSATAPSAPGLAPDGADVVASARGLRKTYGSGEAAVRALDGVAVDIVRGELTAVMGPSGSGKSTLMHCMAALDGPTSGDVVVDGVDISTLKDRALTRLRRDRIGFVFQAFNLVPTLTARENITLPLDIAGADVDTAWFDTVVDVMGLRDRLGHRPSELFGGQQQRVACARALVSRPALVFADEPTGNLDSVASAEILGFLRRSVDDFGQTVVMVTHEPTAAAYADRVLFLADGRIVSELRDPTADSVLERMKALDGTAPARPARGEQGGSSRRGGRHAAGS